MVACSDSGKYALVNPRLIKNGGHLCTYAHRDTEGCLILASPVCYSIAPTFMGPTLLGTGVAYFRSSKG